MSDELFDVVDEQDRVIGQERRSEVHRLGLLHRAVHIFVFRPGGQLLIHLRSATKDEFPLVWTSSASGHVDAGEDYLTAAQRELREELSISVPLRELHRFPASKLMANEHSTLYSCVTDTSVTIDPIEIADIAELPPEIIADRIHHHPESFSQVFIEMFGWHRAHA